MIFLFRVILIAAITSILSSCETTLKQAEGVKTYQCRNTVEVQCDANGCNASDALTPMDVNFDDSGNLSICAYSGCWKGQADVIVTDNFLILSSQNLEFSTSNDSQNATLSLELSDGIATIKIATFALPLMCEKLPQIFKSVQQNT